MSRFRSHGDPLTGTAPDGSTAAVLRRQLPDSIPEPPDTTVVPGELERLSVLASDRWSRWYKARSLASEPNEILEVKTYRLPRSGDLRDGVVRRGRAWAGISNHPHIHSVVAQDTDPVPWLALEPLDAGSLHDRLGDMTGSEMLWIALSVLRALSFAHGRGVFHLALTPRTIRFPESVTSAWDIPQVSAWDRAGFWALDEDAPTPDPRYAAPEEFDPQSYGRPDQSSDVFRAGAVFYHIFAGEPPFDDRDERPPNGNADPVAPSTLDLTLPPQVDTVILRALHPDKALRYETIHDFRGAFEDFLEWYADASVLEAFRTPWAPSPADHAAADLTRREAAALRLVESMGGTATPREFADRASNAPTTRRYRSLRYRSEATKVLDALADAGFLSRYYGGTLYYAVPGSQRGPTPAVDTASDTRADGGAEE